MLLPPETSCLVLIYPESDRGISKFDDPMVEPFLALLLGNAIFSILSMLWRPSSNMIWSSISPWVFSQEARCCNYATVSKTLRLLFTGRVAEICKEQIMFCIEILLLLTS